jgi:protein-disulfide isomerase
MHRAAPSTIVSLALALALVPALAAGCRSTPPAQPAPDGDARSAAELEVRLAALEGRIELLEKVFGGHAGPPQSTAPSTEPLAADSVERVSRVEQRLDKVIGFLKQAVRPEVDANQLYALPIDASDPSVGPADAPVTLVEAFEFLCPYCSMLEPTLDRLRAEYPKTLRVVSKYLVIHGEPAIPAGLAACAAQRQGRYDRYKKVAWSAIWPGEGTADRSQATAEAVLGHAKAAGLDLKRYQADVAPDGPCQAWMASTANVLEKFGFGGTPTIMLNGRLVDQRDYEGLKAAIEAEMVRVRSSGVAPGRYYPEVVLAQGHREAVMISPFD